MEREQVGPLEHLFNIPNLSSNDYHREYYSPIFLQAQRSQRSRRSRGHMSVSFKLARLQLVFCFTAFFPASFLQAFIGNYNLIDFFLSPFFNAHSEASSRHMADWREKSLWVLYNNDIYDRDSHETQTWRGEGGDF